MSDAQNIPVFIRHINEPQGRFLARLPVADLDALVGSMRKHCVYDGGDVSNSLLTQYVAYDAQDRTSYVGFEIIIDSDT